MSASSTLIPKLQDVVLDAHKAAIKDFDEKTVSAEKMEKHLAAFFAKSSKKDRAKLLGELILLGNAAKQRIAIIAKLQGEKIPSNWVISFSVMLEEYNKESKGSPESKPHYKHHLFIEALLRNLDSDTLKLLLPFYIKAQDASNYHWALGEENSIVGRMAASPDEALYLAAYSRSPEVIAMLVNAMTLTQCQQALESIKNIAKLPNVPYWTHATHKDENYYPYYRHLEKQRSYLEAAYLIHQAKRHKTNYVDAKACPRSTLRTTSFKKLEKQIDKASTIAELILIYIHGIDDRTVNKTSYSLFCRETRKAKFIKHLQKRAYELFTKNPKMNAEFIEKLNNTIFAEYHASKIVKEFRYLCSSLPREDKMEDSREELCEGLMQIPCRA